MSRTALVLWCTLTGCSYLGTAQDWDPRSAEDDFVLLRGLDPVRQGDSYDCGPAALTMVLRYLGAQVALEESVRQLSPGRTGVPAGSLRDLARARGFKAHLIEGGFADLEEHLRKERPLIVGLVKPHLTGALPHYEVVAGIDPVQRCVATIDPGRGWTLNTYEGFLDEWAGSGRLLLVIAPGQERP